MPQKRQPTSREIAAASGYSQTAVSHALRGVPKVSTEARDKIVATARQLGWTPNPLVSAYMAHLRSTKHTPPAFKAVLAIFFTSPKGHRLMDQPEHVKQFYEGALARATELGYGVEAIWLGEPHLTAGRLNSILRSRGITGLILPGTIPQADIIEGLDWDRLAGVTLGYSEFSSRLHRVAVDTFSGFTMTLRRLHELGYKRVGVAVAEDYDMLLNHGLLLPAYFIKNELAGRCEVDIHRFPLTSEGEIPHIQEWLRKRRPEVVLGQHVAARAIHSMNWRIPQDIAYASVDRSLGFPDTGGFDQRNSLRAGVAVELLVGQIVQNIYGFPPVPRLVLVPGAWVDGASVPPVHASEPVG